MSYKKGKKVLLTGGGTGGSVSPLLAITEEINRLQIKDCGFQFLWLGTKTGPERIMVEKESIKFKAIANGKLRRYFSLKNFIDPLLIMIGFFQSLAIILVWRPNLIISAGSFVSVPVVWAAWVLRVPILIHQQDVCPGLANKLMAPFAEVITVTFEESLADYGKKAVWTGNPVRQGLTENSKQKIANSFDLSEDIPIVLIVGGGTGAMAINELIKKSLSELTKFCQIIHITGKDKFKNYELRIKNYKCIKFLEASEMAVALRLADVIVSRGGMGLLTELSYLGKPAILIPLPDSHQEDNALLFKEKEAAIVLDQKELTADDLVIKVKELLDDKELGEKLSKNIGKIIKKGANEKIIKIIEKII